MLSSPTLYGSPHQNSRAQQSRHQLSASLHSQSNTRAAFETSDPLAQPKPRASDLSAYPSIQDIQNQAHKHQRYYYSEQSNPSPRFLRNSGAHFQQSGWSFKNWKAQRAGRHRIPEMNNHQDISNGGSRFPGSELYDQLQWSQDRQPMSRERKFSLLRSYLPDWVITLVLTGLLTIINKVHGFRREFDLTDTSIQHTFAEHERVPMWLLGLLVVIIPALIIAAVSLGVSRSVWDLHNGLLGFLLSHALTVTVTTIIKVCVGRPRPDLIDRCQPAAGSVNRAVYGLVTDAICTVGVDNSELRDGFRSFPSGHTSSSFAGLTFLTLYLAGKMHLFDRRGHALTAWLTLTPMLGAMLIAVSRTMDYRHHATDVIAGGLLGLPIAFLAYRLYYPSLSHPQCHKPFSPRIPKEGMASARSGLEESELATNYRHDEESATGPSRPYKPSIDEEYTHETVTRQ